MNDKPQTVQEALVDMAEGIPLPNSDRDPLDAPIDAGALPPAALVDELDNSEAAAAKPEQAAEVATLDFCGDELPERAFPLKYPFRWEGERVDTVTVRQLRTGQLGNVYTRVAAEKRTPELYDFYAEMTGLPAKVLRAIPAVDGEPIIDQAWDFLPPSVRPESG